MGRETVVSKAVERLQQLKRPCTHHHQARPSLQKAVPCSTPKPSHSLCITRCRPCATIFPHKIVTTPVATAKMNRLRKSVRFPYTSTSGGRGAPYNSPNRTAMRPTSSRSHMPSRERRTNRNTRAPPADCELDRPHRPHSRLSSDSK